MKDKDSSLPFLETGERTSYMTAKAAYGPLMLEQRGMNHVDKKVGLFLMPLDPYGGPVVVADNLITAS